MEAFTAIGSGHGCGGLSILFVAIPGSHAKGRAAPVHELKRANNAVEAMPNGAPHFDVLRHETVPTLMLINKRPFRKVRHLWNSGLFLQIPFLTGSGKELFTTEFSLFWCLPVGGQTFCQGGQGNGWGRQSCC